MITRLLLSIGAVLLVAGTIESQAQTASQPSKGRDYRVQAIYRAGVAQKYEIVEQTTSERTFDDGNVKTYSRTAKYYATARCIASQEGIATLVFNLDSLEYKFSADGKDVEYNSQVDITPKPFADLNNYIGPLNRPFELTVSAYGAVSDVKGEQIDFWREYLTENSVDLDSLTYMIWMQSLDNDNLLHYGDLQKRVIPGLRVAIDSTWEHKFGMRIDGVHYAGNVTSTLKDYSGGIFTLNASDTIDVASDKAYVYGIPMVTHVSTGQAVVDYTIQLSSGGTINNVNALAETSFRGKALNVEFTQRTNSAITWNLTGQYQW